MSGQLPETVKVSRVASKENVRWIFLLPWRSPFTDSLPLGSQFGHFQVVDAIMDRRVDQTIQRPNLVESMIQTLPKVMQTQGIETLNFCLVNKFNICKDNTETSDVTILIALPHKPNALLC